jgi:hypothetical protein
VGVDDDGRPAALRLACRVTAAIGLACALAVWELTRGETRSPWLALGFLVFLAAAETFPTHLLHSSESEDLRLEEVFFVPMVVLLAPVEVVVVGGAAITIANVVRRRGGLKCMFNAGMTLAVFSGSVALAHAIGISGQVGIRDVLGAVAGGLFYSVVSSLSVALIIQLAEGVPVATTLLNGSARCRSASWCCSHRSTSSGRSRWRRSPRPCCTSRTSEPPASGSSGRRPRCCTPPPAGSARTSSPTPSARSW